MFDNIGNKIKGLATFFCVAGIIISLISGTVLLATENLIGIAVIALGSLLSWIGSFALYGFGDLVESSRGIYKLLNAQNTPVKKTIKASFEELEESYEKGKIAYDEYKGKREKFLDNLTPVKQLSPFEVSMNEIRKLYGEGKITFNEFMERRNCLINENDSNK